MTRKVTFGERSDYIGYQSPLRTPRRELRTNVASEKVSATQKLNKSSEERGKQFNEMLYIFVLAAVILLSWKFVKVSLFWRSRGIPYEPLPRYLYRFFWESFRQPQGEQWFKVGEKYGPIYGSYQGLRPTLVLTDVEEVKEVFIKQFENFFKRSFEFTTGSRLWDNTLVQLPYEKWKAVRTIMGSTFTTAKMRGMILKLNVIGKRLISKLDGYANRELTLNKQLTGYAVDSITAISFGMDFDAIGNPENELVKKITDILKPTVAGFLFVFFPNIMKYVPFVTFPPTATIRFFEQMTTHVLKEKRAHLDEAIANGTTDLLDLHLIAQRDDRNSILTDDIIASQAFLFLINTDNTVQALEFTTFFLTVSPEAQRKAYNEVRAVMVDRTDVGYEDLQQMKYLEACILESLRLVNIGGFVDRICTSKTVVAGQEIEEGMVVEFNFVHMQKNPRYFPKPEEYLPERFLRSEDGDQQELTAFMMFGHGPKNCIGRRLAIMNIQTMLVHILLKFHLTPTEKTPSLPLKFKPGFRNSDFTVDPLLVKLVPRSSDS